MSMDGLRGSFKEIGVFHKVDRERIEKLYKRLLDGEGPNLSETVALLDNEGAELVSEGYPPEKSDEIVDTIVWWTVSGILNFDSSRTRRVYARALTNLYGFDESAMLRKTS